MSPIPADKISKIPMTADQVRKYTELFERRLRLEAEIRGLQALINSLDQAMVDLEKAAKEAKRLYFCEEKLGHKGKHLAQGLWWRNERDSK